MILLLEGKIDVLKCFYDNQLKYFHDSADIVMTLAPGCEFFSVKWAQSPLTFS